MKCLDDRSAPRRNIWIVIASIALLFCAMTTASEVIAPENLPAPGKSRPGAVGLAVSGATAGITTEYFEQAVTDALVASGIFSGVEHSTTTEVIMPMIGAEGAFSSVENTGKTPYFLTIRVAKVETPSFSVRMTVSMNAIWTLSRTDDKTELLHENIRSTYTGGVLEGGISGANRVRVAMEGAARESARIGVGMLESLDLEQDKNQAVEAENGHLSMTK